ncbi:hypothetical protein SAMN04489742_4896 [Arthrobacter crystallopoietes]|uniref:Uncharacterized protein n=1 Tax=Crystallibacter crystallopoietes TaxID=37928 RepID=A0A1H1I0Y8_9MICC|nr:hypothetical protein SAMN04489742_4896 [Arthrobacter crystallopoietes]
MGASILINDNAETTSPRWAAMAKATDSTSSSILSA